MRRTAVVAIVTFTLAAFAVPAAAADQQRVPNSPDAQPSYLVRVEVEPNTSIIHILPGRSRDVINSSFTMVSANCTNCGPPCPPGGRSIDIVLEATTDVAAGYGVSDLRVTNYSSSGVTYSRQDALEAGEQVTGDNQRRRAALRPDLQALLLHVLGRAGGPGR